MLVDPDKLLLDPNKHSSFCKLLFKEGFMDKILIPPVFIKEHKKMLAKACLLKTDIAGMPWEAKIVREHSNFFICEGDWSQFVVYHKLELGCLLLFYLVDKSTFQVLPYTQKCCTNIRGRQLLEELSSEEEEEEEEKNIRPSRKSGKVKMEPKGPSDPEEESADPSSGSKYGVNLSCLHSVDSAKLLLDPDKHPYFCTLLFKEGFMDKILMPPAFINEHKKMLAKTCLLKTGVEMLWEAKIVRERSNFFICEGDWSQFVVYHKLELGDILLFFLIGRSTFQVLPYTQKCYRNLRGRQLFEELSSSSEEEEDTGPSRKSNKLKLEPNEPSNSEEESVDPSSGSKDGENPCYSYSGHWVLGVLTFKDRCIHVYDSNRGALNDSFVTKSLLPFAFMITQFLTSIGFYGKRSDIDFKNDAYADRAKSDQLLVNLVTDLPQQFNADYGAFIVAFAKKKKKKKRGQPSFIVSVY